MKRHGISKIAIATGLVLAAVIASSATADAKGTRTRFQCKASGSTDISMSARYEIRAGASTRRTFSTEFEAGPGTGFRAGNRLKISVKGVVVGTVRLAALVGGDVVGDLNFDTKRQVDAKPFPANWPKTVGRGAKIQILRGQTRVLGCTLS
jgi:hypothetical protein